jgi:serine/threonine protein kinase/tetratricopeptide (TPR) repeat protein
MPSSKGDGMMIPSNGQGQAGVSISDLMPIVRRSKILSERRCAEIEAKVASGEYPREPELLAESLVRDDILTGYHARRFLENRPDNLIVGRYLLLDRIGAGAMGRVYKAKHLMMGRVVAVKILSMRHSTSGTRIPRFRREMQIVGMLDHPNIVRAFDADQIGGILYIVMEYIPGHSLSELFKTRGRLPIADVIWYGSQAALGLDHAHQRGIVHRDIKPSNILVGDSKKVKILDLGLGVFLEREEDDEFKTEAGVAVGTMDYLSPEQACMRKLDGRSDVYSLGCTMYHLICGRLPYEGESSMERMAVRIAGQTVPLADAMPGLPPQVVRVIEKMLARDPADRFQTAGEASEALRSLIRPRTVPSAISSSPTSSAIRPAPTTPAAAAPPPSPGAATPAPKPGPAAGVTRPAAVALRPSAVAPRPAAPTLTRRAAPTLKKPDTLLSKVRGASPPVKVAMAAVAAIIVLGGVFLLWPGRDRPVPANPADPAARPDIVASTAEPAPAEAKKPTAPPITPPKPAAGTDPAVTANALAAKGMWKEAVAAYHQAIDAHPDLLSLQHRLSLALLKAGDVEAYRQRCKELIDELHGSENAGACDVIRACSLAPGVLTETDWALSLVQGTVNRDPKAAWRLYILGLAHYRADQFDKAIRRLDESIKLDPLWGGTSLNWPVLAMAHQKLGHTQEAQTWLKKARAEKALTASRPAAEASAGTAPWWDRAEFEILRQEAEAMQTAKAAVPPK